MRCSRVTISGCRTVGPETVATAFGGSRRAETASDSSNRLASLSLGLSEPSAHRLATGDALHVLSADALHLSAVGLQRHCETFGRSLRYPVTNVRGFAAVVSLDLHGRAHNQGDCAVGWRKSWPLARRRSPCPPNGPRSPR
jgi:hypothetical protein